MHCLKQLLRTLRKGNPLLQAGGEQAEFVAADPPQQIFRAEHAADRPGHLPQKRVSRRVAEPVVHLFKVVHIHHKQRAAVEQAGQRIRLGGALQLNVLGHLRVHIHKAHIGQPPLRAGHQGHLCLQPPPGPVCPLLRFSALGQPDVFLKQRRRNPRPHRLHLAALALALRGRKKQLCPQGFLVLGVNACLDEPFQNLAVAALQPLAEPGRKFFQPFHNAVLIQVCDIVQHRPLLQRGAKVLFLSQLSVQNVAFFQKAFRAALE